MFQLLKTLFLEMKTDYIKKPFKIRLENLYHFKIQPEQNLILEIINCEVLD